MRTILLITLLFLSGCSDKEKSNQDKKIESNSTYKKSSQPTTTIQEPKYPKFFYIQDIDKRKSKIDIFKDKITFHKIRQKIVILNIFSTECAPCRGMLPYLNDLQLKNKKDVFVLGVRVGEKMSDLELRAFMKKYRLSFFISNYYSNNELAKEIALRLNLPRDYKIPLTVIYKDGKYIIHISGATPPEMIQNIIDQIK
jgi:thiol-disulfide isomerase/thioredoxin